jgi:hypothetical protein
MPLLIPTEKLAAGVARIAAKAAPPAPLPSPTPAPGYTYKLRSQAQWTARASQTADSTFGEPIRPLKTKATKKAIVTGNSLCSACGHPRDVHRQPRPAHPPLEPSTDMPCESNIGCNCQQFSVDGKPYRPRIAISEWILCQSCGHARHQHCTKRKPGLVKRLEPGELPYRILQKPDGGAYPCKHFCLTDNTAQCDSTSCAHTEHGREFCTCAKYVNPWLKPKTKAATEKRPPSKPVAAPLQSVLTLSTPKSVLAKPRRSRKKKTASITGGDKFPPSGTTTESQTT